MTTTTTTFTSRVITSTIYVTATAAPAALTIAVRRYRCVTFPALPLPPIAPPPLPDT